MVQFLADQNFNGFPRNKLFILWGGRRVPPSERMMRFLNCVGTSVP